MYLICAELVALKPQCEVDHVIVSGAWVRGDKVRDQILFFTGGLRVFVEQALEPIVSADTGFHHLIERAILRVLGRNL